MPHNQSTVRNPKAIAVKLLTVFIASALTLYAVWLGVMYWSFETVPQHLYSQPVFVFSILAFAIALVGCVLPLRTARSRILIGAVVSVAAGFILVSVLGD